ncbi:MAG: aconitate hydratase [Alicyclobacillus macrosporangiidus]|uniref:aconitate hydratase n=1 Tax=Alicyclobacillus macrosporangiidus TaxID=392015 RepID=UPI0026ECEA8A|nr:aconitate hydratase [Alicyclobacillus macrosporangiidus]MCL6599516.1 aconitate hydratase [Alicyclobacillus macrosporangiidus]
MGDSLAVKILREHLVSAPDSLKPGREILIRVDHTLTQDATGTMAYLQFEAMGVPRVRTRRSVSYVDHNMLQTGYENMDDHVFLQTFAAKYGVYFSRPGNGICHQVHLERFSEPGLVLLGSDSHTPTCGGAGMLAIGAGGLDVAVAMAGGPFGLPMPKIVGVHLKGRRQPWVAAKDVILEMLRRLTVKGGVGKIFEYYGEGVRDLTVPERATICNMGAELGATTSIFPSDDITRAYFRKQNREKDWRELGPDPDAEYDEHIEIDLSALEPLVAQPHSPDNVVRVRDIEGLPLDQVCIGSCTNSSFHDLAIAAHVLKGRRVASRVSMTLTPGSRQVFATIARNGILADLIAAGARVLEAACGPCIGMGQAPKSGGISLRSFNRNFEGRSGTPDAKVYLCSPETAAVSALRGVLTDPRDFDGPYVTEREPDVYDTDDEGMILPPSDHPEQVEVVRGPNIKPLPTRGPLDPVIRGRVLLKVGDNITTDHIMPAGSKILPLRSNIPAISEYVFVRVDPKFPERAKQYGGGIIVGGSNYGQGSSREHAALAPMYLGVKAVIAKSFARIHRANLINFGILPLVFSEQADYDRIQQDEELIIEDVPGQLRRGSRIEVSTSSGERLVTLCEVSERQRDILLSGGLLNHVKMSQGGGKGAEDAAVHLGTATMISTNGQFRPGKPKVEEVRV